MRSFIYWSTLEKNIVLFTSLSCTLHNELYLYITNIFISYVLCFHTGHKIAKGTGVIINNFELNTSPTYWDDPEVFEPKRFIHHKPDAKPCIKKPEYFLPFSTGKRTCIGQQLVSGYGFVLLAGILQRYDVKVTDQLTIPESSLALPPDAHPLILKPLNGSQ